MFGPHWKEWRCQRDERLYEVICTWFVWKKMLSPMCAGVLVCGLTGFLIYLNTIPCCFTFDDNFAVVRNKDVTNDNTPLASLLIHDFWGQQLSSDQSHKSYRPLTVLCYRLTRQLWETLPSSWTHPVTAWRQTLLLSGYLVPEEKPPDGLDPLPFHVVNVVLHAVVSGMVCWLSYHLLSVRLSMGLMGSSLPDTHAPALRLLLHIHLPAWGTGLLFALHPVHTEAVGGVVGQAELLCAALSILAMMLYFTAAQMDIHAVGGWGGGMEDGGDPAMDVSLGVGQGVSAARHWCLVGGALVGVLAAALCKEIGIAVVGCMVLYDVGLVPIGAGEGGTGDKGRDKAVDKGGDKGGDKAVARTGGLKGFVMQRKWLRLACAFVLVVGYVKGRSFLAGDQLVRIYRKVENPIPFLPTWQERVLNTGYLHTRYAALLLWPQHLSADWSYPCIKPVEQIWDIRNLGVVILYAYLLMMVVMGRPWMVLVQWWRSCQPLREEGVCPSLGVAGWRLVILIGLVVAPFFPASNVLFYVGTFIGERLLYFPSVGAMLLLNEVVFGVVLSSLILRPQVQGTFNPTTTTTTTTTSASQRLASALRRMCVVLVCVLFVIGLVAAAGRTWTRNWDWLSEEALFVSAQKVCGDSAKVALNSGILARRHKNHEAALRHFEHARQLEPGFCEPGFWIGSTLINLGRVGDGMIELENALTCKWVSADALTALNTLYQMMHDSAPQTGFPMAKWGALLCRPHVGRVVEGCETLESAALTFLASGDVAGAGTALAACENALEDLVTASDAADDEKLSCATGGRCKVPSDTLADRSTQLTAQGVSRYLACIRMRRKIYRDIGTHGPSPPDIRHALYKYLGHVLSGPGGADCRLNAQEWLHKHGVPPRLLSARTPDHVQGVKDRSHVAVETEGVWGGAYPHHDIPHDTTHPYNPPAHMHLIHRLQSLDAEDPWLQWEWGVILCRIHDRGPDAVVHMTVAGVIFMQWAQAKTGGVGTQGRRLGGTPTSLSMEPLDMQGALEAAADVLWDVAGIALRHPGWAEMTALRMQGLGMGLSSVCDLVTRSLDARMAAAVQETDGAKREVRVGRLKENFVALAWHLRLARTVLAGAQGAGEGSGAWEARDAAVVAQARQLVDCQPQLEQLQRSITQRLG